MTRTSRIGRRINTCILTFAKRRLIRPRSAPPAPIRSGWMVNSSPLTAVTRTVSPACIGSLAVAVQISPRVFTRPDSARLDGGQGLAGRADHAGLAGDGWGCVVP